MALKKQNNSLHDLIRLEQEARDFGFDWPDVDMILKQALSECEEIREAIDNKESLSRVQEETGDLLHTAISLCCYLGFDVEQTLDLTVKKFGARMAALKKATHEVGLLDLKEQPSDFMLSLWEKAKKNIK